MKIIVKATDSTINHVDFQADVNIHRTPKEIIYDICSSKEEEIDDLFLDPDVISELIFLENLNEEYASFKLISAGGAKFVADFSLPLAQQPAIASEIEYLQQKGSIPQVEIELELIREESISDSVCKALMNKALGWDNFLFDKAYSGDDSDKSVFTFYEETFYFDVIVTDWKLEMRWESGDITENLLAELKDDIVTRKFCPKMNHRISLEENRVVVCNSIDLGLIAEDIERYIDFIDSEIIGFSVDIKHLQKEIQALEGIEDFRSYVEEGLYE